VPGKVFLDFQISLQDESSHPVLTEYFAARSFHIATIDPAFNTTSDMSVSSPKLTHHYGRGGAGGSGLSVIRKSYGY
jgi:hypothetical protein